MQEAKRGSFIIKVPKKHEGARMVFPVSLSDNILLRSGPEYRINITIDSHPHTPRKITDVIVIYEE